MHVDPHTCTHAHTTHTRTHHTHTHTPHPPTHTLTQLKKLQETNKHHKKYAERDIPERGLVIYRDMVFIIRLDLQHGLLDVTGDDKHSPNTSLCQLKNQSL